VSDPDDTQLEGATVSIGTNFESGDELVFVDQSGITGTYNSGTGVLTLTGPDTLANYQTVLRSITFETTGPNPTRALQWRLDDGEAANNLSVIVNSVINLAGTTLNDFTGDTQSDIFWRDENGVLVLWEMDGPTISQNTRINTISTRWEIQEVSDYNGDFHADILWRNADDGTVVMWEMDAPGILTNSFVDTVPTTWEIIA
jgi:hypothetical protein